MAVSEVPPPTGGSFWWEEALSVGAESCSCSGEELCVRFQSWAESLGFQNSVLRVRSVF